VQSKGKPAPTKAERAHLARLAEQPCVVCDGPGEETHELRQGYWFTSLRLCADCHRGGVNGIHGQRRIWNVKKLDELSALNEQLRRLFA